MLTINYAACTEILIRGGSNSIEILCLENNEKAKSQIEIAIILTTQSFKAFF